MTRGPAAAEPLLPCVEVEPEGPADAAVVWMHGLGADGNDFVPVVPHLGLPRGLRVRFVFPHAPAIPVSLNFGMVMPAWYDLAGSDLRHVRHDEAGVRASAARIEQLVARERDRGVPDRRIVLAGFSQGGAMALFAGLRHRERLAGVLALSSFLVLPELLPDERSPANRDVPILLCHGTADPMVPEEFGRVSRDTLARLGYRVDYETYPMQHEVCLEEIRRIGAWLAERLASGGAPTGGTT